MTNPRKLYCEAFKSLGQVLQLGQSTFSLDDAKTILNQIKSNIESHPVESKPGWNEPGKRALDVINTILSGGHVDNSQKQWAKLDVESNYRMLDSDSFTRALDMF